MIINLRGTNGSGKTTLARALIGPDATPVDLISYKSPTKRNPDRYQWVDGWGTPGGFFAIGSYKQGCGGMDTIPTFDLQQQAIAQAYSGVRFLGEPPAHIVCEGVLASTVAGSWLEFFKRYPREEVLVAYLNTPLELCLERIKARQIASGRGEREIKVDLVKDKIKAIAATRPKFSAAGFKTVELDWRTAELELREIADGR